MNEYYKSFKRIIKLGIGIAGKEPYKVCAIVGIENFQIKIKNASIPYEWEMYSFLEFNEETHVL